MRHATRSQALLLLLPILVGLAISTIAPTPAPTPRVVVAAQAMPPGGELVPASVNVLAATVVRVVDGDTLDADVSLPAGLTVRARLRLLGINCPETHGATRDAGKAATAFVEGLAPTGTPLVVRSAKTDAFGRWLADAWVDGRHLNAAILEAGHAAPFP